MRNLGQERLSALSHLRNLASQILLDLQRFMDYIDNNQKWKRTGLDKYFKTWCYVAPSATLQKGRGYMSNG